MLEVRIAQQATVWDSPPPKPSGIVIQVMISEWRCALGSRGGPVAPARAPPAFQSRAAARQQTHRSTPAGALGTPQIRAPDPARARRPRAGCRRPIYQPQQWYAQDGASLRRSRHHGRGRSQQCQQARSRGAPTLTGKPRSAAVGEQAHRGADETHSASRLLRWFLAGDPAPLFGRLHEVSPHQGPGTVESGPRVMVCCRAFRRSPHVMGPRSPAGWPPQPQADWIVISTWPVRGCRYRPPSISATASAPPHRRAGHPPDLPVFLWSVGIVRRR